MHTNRKPLFLSILMFTIPLFLLGQGWIIEDADGNVTLISGDKFKVDDAEEGSFTSIYDLSDRSLTMVSHEQQTYATGTMDDYCGAIQSLTNAMMEAMTPEQREMMEAFLSESDDEPTPKVTINKTNEKEEVSGYSTIKYEVMADGELFEEVWVTTDKRLEELVKMFTRVEPVTRELVGCAAFEVNLENDPEFSEAYLELMRTGMEMKSIRYEYGTPEPGTTLVRIEQKTIPASEFTPPEGYTEMGFQEFLKAQGAME